MLHLQKILLFLVLCVLLLVADGNSGQEEGEEGHWNKNHHAVKYLATLRAQTLSLVAARKMKPCHYFPIDARNEFYKGTWQQLLPKSHYEYVNFYSPCMTSYNLGNNLGNYFNELACAAATNTSVIIGKKLWDYPTMPYEYKGQFREGPASGRGVLAPHNLALFESLPEIFDSANSFISTSVPNSPDSENIVPVQKKLHADLVGEIKAACPCDKYCWSDLRSPWVQHHQIIRKLLSRATNAHLFSVEKSLTGIHTVLQESDLCYNSNGNCSSLPLLPDVVVHYRCGDTVPSTTYGFLPFRAVADLIPSTAMSIFILTDPSARATIMSHNIKFHKNCPAILRGLFEYLKERFPKAIIVVKAGGDPFLDYVRIIRAKVSICSASTFCLWPAIASKGRAYFPVSTLVAGWQDNNSPLPFLGKHFHWLTEPRIITAFKDETPVKDALNELTQPFTSGASVITVNSK